jgi:LPS-assembly lipoprotein
MRSQLHRTTALLLLGLVVSGCGFHLRGSGESAALPASLQTLELSSADPGNGVMRSLRTRLRSNGVTVATTSQPATPELNLGAEQVQERIISLNSSARAGEYSLTLQVSFQLIEGGSVILGPETVTEEQIYLADPDNAIAKSEEAELILGEMRNALADQIIRQLASLAP